MSRQQILRAVPPAVKELVREAYEQGWSIEVRRSGHLRWTSPTGAVVSTSMSASDRNAAHNIRRDLRRQGFVPRRSR